jgi:hypothetical protein
MSAAKLADGSEVRAARSGVARIPITEVEWRW